MQKKDSNATEDETLEVEPTQLEKRLIEAFSVFDNAGAHQVDVTELGTIIRSIGCVITEAELQEIQVELEDVENNCVPQHQFVNYMTKAINERRFHAADPEDLLQAFQVLDPENRGYVLRKDLEKALTEIGEPFTAQEVNEMMSVACNPKTNRIYYENYINTLIPHLPEEKNVFLINEAEKKLRMELEAEKLNL